MPLKKGKSKKTISRNIATSMREYKKKGRIGKSKPKSAAKARKQAVAIAYAKAGKSRRKRK
jgi:hypothetical protein